MQDRELVGTGQCLYPTPLDQWAQRMKNPKMSLNYQDVSFYQLAILVGFI